MMTTEERQKVLDDICKLPTDEERVSAYLSLSASENAEYAQMVWMCSCENWETCEHPWPMRMPELNQLGRR